MLVLLFSTQGFLIALSNKAINGMFLFLLWYLITLSTCWVKNVKSFLRFYFPKIHNTPTDSSNMIMLIKSKENKAIKNEIIETANEKAEKINNESTEDIEKVDLKK